MSDHFSQHNSDSASITLGQPVLPHQLEEQCHLKPASRCSACVLVLRQFVSFSVTAVSFRNTKIGESHLAKSVGKSILKAHSFSAVHFRQIESLLAFVIPKKTPFIVCLKHVIWMKMSVYFIENKINIYEMSIFQSCP